MSAQIKYKCINKNQPKFKYKKLLQYRNYLNRNQTTLCYHYKAMFVIIEALRYISVNN